MYTVIIKQEVKTEGDKPNTIDRTILEQKLEKLDVQAVIAVVNGLEKPKVSKDAPGGSGA